MLIDLAWVLANSAALVLVLVVLGVCLGPPGPDPGRDLRRSGWVLTATCMAEVAGVLALVGLFR